MDTKAVLEKYLKDKDIYKPSDDLIIDQLPTVIDIIKQCVAEIESDGIIIISGRGEPRKNPAVEVHNLYLNKLREFMIALGMTPKERRKLEDDLREEKDDFDDD